MKTLLLALALLCLPAFAAPLALPAPPAASFDPRPGARLPLELVFRDETGRALTLGQLFGQRPVVLVPGYYRCSTLCSTVFDGVVQALALSGLPGGAYRLAAVSIDPADTPALAAVRQRAYAAILPAGAEQLHLLAGGPDATAAFARAIGMRTNRMADGELAHAAGFIVARADGRIAYVFSGVRFEPAALRAAVRDAGEGGIAHAFGQRLLLLCAHVDPAFGRATAAALWAVRAVCLAAALALALLWRRRTR